MNKSNEVQQGAEAQENNRLLADVRCDLCGNLYEWDDALVGLAFFPGGETANACPDCVCAGAIGASQRMVEYSERLEKRAADLRELAPSVAAVAEDDWPTAMEVLLGPSGYKKQQEALAAYIAERERMRGHEQDTSSTKGEG